MSIDALLSAHGLARARAITARLARLLILLGGALIAVSLFLERAGIPVLPLVGFPDLPASGPVERVFAFFTISLLGLAQGAALLLGLFLLAYLVRAVGPLLLRPGAAEVARALDRALDTDRFEAALEARGPLEGLVRRRAVLDPPPAGLLGARPAPRRERWLKRIVVFVVLLVALVPGRAPASEGGTVTRPPEGGTEEREIALRLIGEREVIAPLLPAPVIVLLEASFAPLVDLSLPVSLRIDGGALQPTGTTLFLPAGAPGQDATGFDLRPYLEGLKPGDHEAVARAGILESNVYRFRIEAPPGDGGQKPRVDPGAPPPPAPAPGGGPEETTPKFVEPLVKGDEQVKKKAKVPIEVPGGGGGVKEQPLEQAWPELERRREEALNRPGLSPAAKKLVREYFERLRPEGK
jgi:hypothetical protein